MPARPDGAIAEVQGGAGIGPSGKLVEYVYDLDLL